MLPILVYLLCPFPVLATSPPYQWEDFRMWRTVARRSRPCHRNSQRMRLRLKDCATQSSLHSARGLRCEAATVPVSIIPDTMLAAQIIEYNKPHKINRIPTPQSLRKHELLVKVVVASICHSDLEYLKGGLNCALPVTGSHEGTGIVVARGSEAVGFQINDRVLVGQTFGRCGECEICKGPENYRHYCTNRETMMSVERNGAWQEYLVVDARETAKLPDEMSFVTAAPLACAGVTSWRGVVQCDLKPGDWLGIVGSGGGLGHLGIQFAKAKGLKVLGVDARDEGLALSKEAGADAVLDARNGTDEIGREAHEIADGRGVHATINVSDARHAAATACAITRNHGRMIQIALVSALRLLSRSYCLTLNLPLLATRGFDSF